MNRRKKRIVSVMIVTFGIMLSMPAVITRADTTLRSWNKVLTRGVWTFLNDTARSKSTSSSIYLSYTGGGEASDFIQATVYSSHSADGSFERIVYNGKETPIYKIYKENSKYMVNYVYETGQKFVKICVLASNTNTCSGKMQIDLN